MMPEPAQLPPWAAGSAGVAASRAIWMYSAAPRLELRIIINANIPETIGAEKLVPPSRPVSA